MFKRISLFGIFSFCFACVVVLKAGQSPPPPPPTVHVVREGLDLHITCNASHTPGVEIFWVKNDTKSEFRRNGTELIFDGIRRNATGEYVCYAHNMTAKDNSTVIVEIDKVDVTSRNIDCGDPIEPPLQGGAIVYPQSMFLRRKKNDPAEITGFYVAPSEVIEKNYFDVFCNFNGNPTPDFIIMNNRTKHVYVEAQASIAVTDHVQATCEDQATWVCTGRNNLTQGENVTISANVTVFCGPHPDYDKMKDRYQVHARMGESPDLIMLNLGNPYPNYTWSHKGQVLPREIHVDYGFASILHLSNLQISDFGSYGLDMANAYGSYHANYDLIQIKPNIPLVQKAIEGDDVKIDCHVNQTRDIEIYWVKNDTKVGFRQNGTQLSFTSIQREASGDYICYSNNVTSDGNATVMEMVKVDVLYPAEIVGFNVTPTLVHEYKYFDVFCNFTGNPIPDFIVMNNRTKHINLEAHAATGVYNNIQATCEDEATWVCTGRNGLNIDNVTRTANVTVLCGPHPHYDYMENKYQVRTPLGTSNHFIMYNYGTAPVNFTWKRNGKAFPPEAHKDFDVGSILYLEDVKVEDYGDYSLDMENAYGSDHRNYELIPEGPPQRPTNLIYSDVTSNSARLQWTSGFDMGSPQHFIVMQLYEDVYIEFSSYIYGDSAYHGIGEKLDYLLTGLDPDTFYIFDILADNEQPGYDPVMSEHPVMFRTKSLPTTTTEFPFLGSCCTAAVIVSVSLGGLGCIGVLIGIVAIIIQRRRGSYSGLKHKTKHGHHAPPLQLVVTPEMTKEALR